jgi:hypothetical protein
MVARSALRSSRSRSRPEGDDHGRHGRAAAPRHHVETLAKLKPAFAQYKPQEVTDARW